MELSKTPIIMNSSKSLQILEMGTLQLLIAFPKLPNFNLFYRCPEYEVLNIHIMTLCTIWNHFCNLKNVKNSYGALLLLVECRLQPSTLLKVTLLHGCFSGSLNCRNGTKLCKVSDYSGRFFMVLSGGQVQSICTGN